MKVEIRKTTSQDSEDLIKLNNLVWRDAYSLIFSEQVFVERENNNLARIEFKKNFKFNQNGSVNLVAVVNGEIVAYLDGQIESQYEYFKNLGYADLCAIYINPKFQRAGIGTMLFNKFVAEIKRLGATKFVIGVLKDNLKARKVYEKWGGKLNNHTQPLTKLNKDYEEVFYTFKI